MDFSKERELISKDVLSTRTQMDPSPLSPSAYGLYEGPTLSQKRYMDSVLKPEEPSKLESLLDIKNAKVNRLHALSPTSTGVQLQQALSDMVDQQVYTSPNGDKYQEMYTKDTKGNTVITKVPYTKETKYGVEDTRNLYIDTTVDTNMKLGLAATGKGGYAARYKEELGGWIPGPKGVTPENGALMDIVLPYNIATKFEHDVHSNRGQLANRAIGQGPVSAQDTKDYGSGKTEYTTQNAPMWNQSTTSDVNLLAGTPLPKQLEASHKYDKSGVQLQKPGYVSNLIDAAQYGVGRKSAGIVDAIVDAGGALAVEVYAGIKGISPEKAQKHMAKTMMKSFAKDYYDEKGNFIGVDKYKTATEYGYDDSRTQAAMADWGKAWDSGSSVEMVKSLARNLDAAPEFILESAGEFASAPLRAAGVVLNTFDYANKTLERRQKETGKEYTTLGDKALAGLTGLGQAVLNKAGFDEMIGRTKLIEGIVGKMATIAPEKLTKNVVINAIKRLGSALTVATGKGLYEGTEEVMQQFLDIVGARIGEDNANKIFSNEVGRELFQSFGGGFAAGAGMKAPSIVKEGAIATYNLAEIPLGAIGLGNVGERISTALGTPANPEAVKMPQTSDERQKWWDDVSNEAFKVETPEAKAAYTNAVAQHAVDLMYTPEVMKGSGTVSTKVYSDAADKIAKINGLDAESDKAAIQYMLAAKAVSHVSGKNVGTSTYSMPEEQRTEAIKVLSEFVKGNSAAEGVLVKNQKEDIKRVFDEMIALSGEDPEVSKVYFDTKNASVLAGLGAMKPEQYEKLLTAVKGMRVLGSEEATETADTLESTIKEMRAYAVNVLGSAKEDKVGGKKTPLPKRTFEDVANDVEVAGFLGDEGQRLSIKEHGNALERFAGTGIDETQEDYAINQVADFANKHRGLNKVLTHSLGADKTPKINTLKGIRDIVTSKIRENTMLLKTLKVAEARDWKNDVAGKKNIVTSARQQLELAQKDHEELLKKIDSQDPKIRRSVYVELNALKAEPMNSAVLEAQLTADTRTNRDGETILAWDLLPGESAKIDLERTIEKFVNPEKTGRRVVPEKQVLDAVEAVVAGEVNTVEEAKTKVTKLTDILSDIAGQSKENRVKLSKATDRIKEVRKAYEDAIFIAGTQETIDVELKKANELANGIIEQAEVVQVIKPAEVVPTIVQEPSIVEEPVAIPAQEVQTPVKDEEIPTVRKTLDRTQLKEDLSIGIKEYRGDTKKRVVKRYKNNIMERLLAGADNAKGTFEERKKSLVEALKNSTMKDKELLTHLVEFANSITEEYILIGSIEDKLEDLQITEDNIEKLSEAYIHGKKLAATLRDYYAKLVPIKAKKREIAKKLMEKRRELRNEISKITAAEKDLDDAFRAARLTTDYGMFKDKFKWFMQGIKSAVLWIKAYKKIAEATKEDIVNLRGVIDGLNAEENKIRGHILRIKDNIEEAASHEEKVTERIARNMDEQLYKDTKKAEKGAYVEKAKARTLRGVMEKYLGRLVTPNNNASNSLSAMISKGATALELMKIMPRVITKNVEYGKTLVDGALKTLEGFRAMRDSRVSIKRFKADGKTLTKISVPTLFTMQTGENNPLNKIMIGDDKISFMDMATSNEQIAEHVLTAIDVTGLVTLKDMLDTKMLNKEFMEKLIESAFAQTLLQIDKTAKPDESYEVKQFKKMDAKRELVRLIQQEGIVPESAFIEAAGQFLWQQLELKFAKEGLKVLDKDKLVKALGVLVVNNLLPSAPYKDADNTVSRASVKYVGNKVQVVTEMGQEGETGIRVLQIGKITKEYAKEVREAAKAFEYASESRVKLISDKPIKPSKKVNKGAFDNADSQVDYLTHLGEIKHTFSDDFADMLDATEDTDTIVTALLGNESELSNKFGPHEFESALAKYEAERLVIERMIDVYRLVGREGFYIGWSSTVAGRSMMESTLLNPQASGITRHIVHSEGMVNTINPAEVTPEQLNHIESAIAQALDIDPVKKPEEQVLKELHDKIVSIAYSGVNDTELALVWGTKLSKMGKLIKELVTRKDFALSDLRGRMDEMNIEYAAEGDVKPFEIGSKTIMHVVQAIELLRKIKGNKGELIKTTLNLEADGITNAMAFILQQLGFGTFSEEFMPKVGMYEEKDGTYDYENHGEYLEEKDTDGEKLENKDGYNTVEEPVKQEIEAVDPQALKDLEAVLKGVSWRNFLKEPVMTFLYGSGMTTIRRNLALSLVIGNSYIKGGLGRGKIKELIALSGVTGIEVQYKKFEKSELTGGYEMVTYTEANSHTEEGLEVYNNPKFASLDEWQIQQLVIGIDNRIGEQFQAAFEKKFASVIKFRKALKAIEQVNFVYFSTILKDKIRTKLAGRLVTGSMSDLSTEELTEIQDEMIAEGTWYSAKGAEGTEVEYYKKQSSDADSWMNEPITVTINSGTFQSQTGHDREYNVKVQQILSNIGAIGVTTTHNQDAAVQIIANKDGGYTITGKRSDVLNIYDAVVMGTNLEANTEVIQSLNIAFYKVGIENSMIGTALTKMKLMKSKAEGLGKDPQALYDSMAGLKRIFGAYSKEEIAKMHLSIEVVIETIEEIDAGRKLYKDATVLVNQYSAGSGIPGVKMTSEGLDFAETIPYEGALDELTAELNDLLNEAKDNTEYANEQTAAREKAKTLAAKFSTTMAELKLSEDEQTVMYNEIKEILRSSYTIEGLDKMTRPELLEAMKKAIELTC